MSRLPLALQSEEGGTLRIFAIEQGSIAIRQEGPGGLNFEARMDLAVTAMIRDALDAWVKEQQAGGMGA